MVQTHNILFETQRQQHRSNKLQTQTTQSQRMIRTEMVQPTVTNTSNHDIMSCRYGYNQSPLEGMNYVIRKRSLPQMMDDSAMMMVPTTTTSADQEHQPPFKKRRLVISLPSTNKSPADKKQVTFSQEPPKVYTRHMNDADLQNAWYSPVEFAKLRQEAREEITNIIEGREDNDDSCCLRGLEHHTSIPTMLYYKQRRQNFILNILQQQEVQRQLGIEKENDMSLRLISFMHSKESREEALRLGALDAFEQQQQQR